MCLEGWPSTLAPTCLPVCICVRLCIAASFCQASASPVLNESIPDGCQFPPVPVCACACVCVCATISARGLGQSQSPVAGLQTVCDLILNLASHSAADLWQEASRPNLHRLSADSVPLRFLRRALILIARAADGERGDVRSDRKEEGAHIMKSH